MNNDLAELIQYAIEQLFPLYTHPEAESVVWWMLSAITGKTKLELLFGQESLSDEHKIVFRQWLHEHTVNHKPLAYLIGSVPFMSSTIAVEPPLLIPRPETEEWVSGLIHMVQKLSNKKITILDLCSGTGALACALAQAVPEARVVAADISEIAVAVTRKNAAAHGVAVTCIQSDLFSALSGMQFDLIVTNPPYISHAVWQGLEPMVKDWEDYHALVAPEEGLYLIRSILEQAPNYLMHNPEMVSLGIPQLYCEIGYDQGVVALQLMQKYFSRASLLQDYHGNDRVVCGSLL